MILKDLFGTITVDAFTFEEGIDKMFPIKESLQYTPAWWKNLPIQWNEQSEEGVIYPASTMKRCVGFTDLYKRSFTLPLWADISITTTEEGKWAFYSPYEHFVVDHHNMMQYGPAFNNYIHLKFFSPWLMQEKTGIHFVFTSAMWNNPDLWNRLFLCNGLLDFKYQPVTHINFFVNRINQNIQLIAGTPMMHLVPMTDKKVKLKRHVISKQEHEDMWNRKRRSYFFVNGYRKYKKYHDSN